MPERFAEALQWAVVEHVSVSVRAEGRKIILTQRGGSSGKRSCGSRAVREMAVISVPDGWG